MGNCAPHFIERRSARRSFDFNSSGSKRAPLYVSQRFRIFQVKTWPLLKTFDLQDTENCYQRSIDASLYEGQHIEINLKSSPQRLSRGEENSDAVNYSLRCEISKKDKCYTIKFPVEEERKYLWRFIGKWIEIHQGNIIRMGKTKYRLSKLVHQKQMNAYRSLKNIAQSLTSIPNEKQTFRCRICLSSVETQDDPLISPCKCTGSVKYTHLKCLSNWLFSLSNDEEDYIRIRVNKSVCQLCKTDITGTPEYEKMTDILLGSANNIPSPYAIFEIYQREEERERNYFILCFNTKDSYTFGRSSKADICDPHDKCISKFNTEILYKQRRLLIKDCESTHGTFMKVEGDLKLYASNQQEDISYRNMIIKARYIPLLDKE